MTCPPWWFLLPALAGTAFYGFFCFQVFGVSTDGKPWPWILHQGLFNALGAACGWLCCWLACSRNTGVDAWAVALSVVAFVGITGHLPKVVVGLVMAPGEIFGKVLGIKSGGS